MSHGGQRTSGHHLINEREVSHMNNVMKKLMSEHSDIFPFQGDRFRFSDEDLIYRFLVAKGWREEGAVKGIVKYFHWRKESSADEVFNTPHYPYPEKMFACSLNGFYGKDKDGYPVRYDRPIPEEIVQAMETLPWDTIVKHHIAVHEVTRAQQQHLGKDRTTVVLDLKHVGLHSIKHPKVFSLMGKFADLDQQMYPENLKAMYCINSPTTIRFIWKLAKHLFCERTQQKIVFLHHADELGKYFERGMNDVPVEFEGTAPAGSFVPIKKVLEVAHERPTENPWKYFPRW